MLYKGDGGVKNWEYELAKEFKTRDNPKRLGAILGKVISTSPVKIAIQDGKFFIGPYNVYVCNQILERSTTFNNYSADMSGTINVKCRGGSGGSYTGDIKADGSVHLNEVWKAGDFVMVVPDESGQHFFIVDIVKGVS